MRVPSGTSSAALRAAMLVLFGSSISLSVFGEENALRRNRSRIGYALMSLLLR